MKKMFKTVGADLPAAIVVFLVALPLCLGIALGSGAPMFSGLIAGIVGGIVIGSLSGSHLSISGPAAGLTVIVFTAIGKLPGFEAFLLAVVLSGIFQIILGYVKAGILGDYVPSSVITGMLAAIGLILILKQIPHLLGYDASFEGDEQFREMNKQNTFSTLLNAFWHPTSGALLIGSIALVLQVIWDRYFAKKYRIFKLIPAPLIVVITAVVINLFFQNQGHAFALTGDHLVNIPIANSANEFASFFTFPNINFITLPDVWITALTLAIVASLETLINVEAADELDPFKRITPKNRELRAQGVGNILSGLIGGLPVTSVVVRTTANIHAGAKSKMSAIYHGMLLAVSVAVFPGILNRIPLSALAAVLIYTGFKLASPAVFIKHYKKGMDQFLPFIITIIAILLTDLLVGITLGMLTGLFFILRSNFKTAILVVNEGNKYLIRLRKDVSFLNKPILKSKLEEIPEGSFLFIDTTKADFIDKDIIEVINDFGKHAHLKNITLEIRQSINKPEHQLFHHELQSQPA